MEKILAIDPATLSGFAITKGPSGHWDLAVKRDESKGMRLVKLKKKLNYFYKKYGFDIVVFEAARNARHQGPLVVQAEFQGVIKIWCELKGIEYRGYSPGEIKKHATDNGNASKKEMVAAAEEYFEIDIIDDNHADALWLLDLATNELLEEDEFE